VSRDDRLVVAEGPASLDRPVLGPHDPGDRVGSDRAGESDDGAFEDGYILGHNAEIGASVVHASDD